MKTIAVVAVAVAACLGLVLEVRRRRQERASAPTLVQDWKAFLRAPAAKGEPSIAPADVPDVRPLKARTSTRFDRFAERLAGGRL